MILNRRTLTDSDAVAQALNRRPYEVDGDSEVDLLEFETSVLVTLGRTDMSCVDVTSAEADGFDHIRVSSFTSIDTTTFILAPQTPATLIHGAGIDAHKSVVEMLQTLGVEATRDGGDYLVDGDKVAGAVATNTDGLAVRWNLHRPLPGIDTYTDFPERKLPCFAEGRAGILNDFTDGTVTIDDIEQAIQEVMGE